MPKKGKILDLGCGSGRDSLYFQNLGYDCIAVDPIDEFLEHA
jgi:ubiquinone/menaquinone biosynthesis C-methylase UbiE